MSVDGLVVFASNEGVRSYFSALGITDINADWSGDLLKLSKRLVLTGTCLGPGPDKKGIERAAKIGLHSVAVVDHWSWYRKRFEVSDGLLLPDKILVNDDIAYEDAITDGLPAERLVALGNPVLEDLAIRSVGYERDMHNQRVKQGIPQGKRVIVFISEDIQSDFKPGTEDYLGYDEYQVVEHLLSLLKSNDNLVIKLHPVENDDKYSYLPNNRVSIIRHSTVEDLASLGDVIVGMASMLLLELAMFRDDIISFRPGATKSFIGERLGATVKAGSIEELWYAVEHDVTVKSDFSSRFVGSRERIIQFLEGMAR